MGNCCKAEYSSMEWDGEDWESLRSSSNQSEKKPAKACSSSSSSSRNKVFDEESANLDHKKDKNDLLGKIRGSCDANGKVTLKISKCELAELLGAIQNSNNQQPSQNPIKKKELACAEQVLFRLMKAREHEIAKKHHCGGSHWKPMLDTIPEC